MIGTVIVSTELPHRGRGGGRSTTRITAGLVLLITSVSFGLDTVASLRMFVPDATPAATRTETLIVGKAVPALTLSDRVHVKLFVVCGHTHPAPDTAFAEAKDMFAGRVSTTLVSPTTAPLPSLRTTIW